VLTGLTKGNPLRSWGQWNVSLKKENRYKWRHRRVENGGGRVAGSEKRRTKREGGCATRVGGETLRRSLTRTEGGHGP